MVKKEDSYHIGRCVGKQGPQFSVVNQAGIKKLAIGTYTDSNGNDPGLNKKTTATAKERTILLVKI